MIELKYQNKGDDRIIKNKIIPGENDGDFLGKGGGLIQTLVQIVSIFFGKSPPKTNGAG